MTPLTECVKRRLREFGWDVGEQVTLQDDAGTPADLIPGPDAVFAVRRPGRTTRCFAAMSFSPSGDFVSYKLQLLVSGLPYERGRIFPATATVEVIETQGDLRVPFVLGDAGAQSARAHVP